MAARSCMKLCGEKLTKSEKRALRKQRCKMYSMQKHNTELEISEEPTSHVLVGNGGLMNGIDRTQIMGLFKTFGILERVIMVPQQSYSFVSFKNVDDAKKAMSDISGKKLDPFVEFSKTGVILYLSFLKHVPDDVTGPIRDRPPGLVLIENFIDEEEEQELLKAFRWDDEKGDSGLTDQAAQKQLKHRRVKHFGYEFLYGTNNIDTTKPLPGGIPEVCNGVIHHMTSSGHIKSIPDQLTVNEYTPGQGIPPHVDTHSAFEDGIISISLGAKITMEFRHPDGRHISVLLPRKSLLIMTGESRYQWTHGITPRKFDITNEDPQPLESSPDDTENNDANSLSTGVTQYERETRISLTFRKVKHGPCKCNFPKLCDSQNYNENSSPDSSTYTLPTTQQDAERLESTHVHDVYEQIADHFSDTRHSPWPKIAKFLCDIPKGSLVADVGCGNGKYLGINDNIFKTGSDRSFNLAAIAKERGHSVIVCDVLNLPYRSEAFDVCICIAVLHHLSTTERRFEGLRELVRIVRPGGMVLVYVWALEQKLEKIKKSELKEVEFNARRSEMSGNSSGPSLITNDVTESNFENKVVNNSDFAVETQKVQINAKREVFEQQDLFVPWKFRGGGKDKKERIQIEKNEESKSDDGVDPAATNVFHRFYHVFRQGELLDLCSRLGNVVAKDAYYDRGNWCVVLEKTDQ